MTTDANKFQMPTETEIAEYAYYLWEAEGRIAGRDLDYWLQAKTQLTLAREHEAGFLKMNSQNAEVKGSASSSAAGIPAAPRSTTKASRKRSARSVQTPSYV